MTAPVKFSNAITQSIPADHIKAARVAGLDRHPVEVIDVIGDAHVNNFENRHSFLRQWLAKFRGVSKHHLQGYLNFRGLLLNDDTDWFSKILSYESSG